MKIEISRTSLLQGLADVAPFAPTKTAINVLRYTKVTTKDNRIKLEATDSSVCMIKYIRAENIDVESSSFLVEASSLGKFLAKLSDPSVSIEVNESSLIVRYARGKGEFPVLNAEDFPIYKEDESEEISVTVDASIMANYISNARNFVSTDAIKPVIASAYVYVKDNMFGYCATDTHRMICDANPIDSAEDVECLIPSSVFAGILNICKKNNELELRINESHVKIYGGDTRLIVTQPKGKFPNFKRVIPQDNPIECVVNRNEMRDCVNRISTFCSSSVPLVKMNVTRMDMTISTNDLDTGKQGSESIPHDGCNDEIIIGLNANNLSACMNAVPSENVKIEMHDKSRPVLFRSSEPSNLTILAMPMVINE